MLGANSVENEMNQAEGFTPDQWNRRSETCEPGELSNQIELPRVPRRITTCNGCGGQLQRT
eukprot:6662402-Karenia_brevis.AAC.1